MSIATNTAHKNKSRFHKTAKKMKRFTGIYVMILPVLIYFAIFTFWPMGMGLVQSVQKEQLFKPAIWIGFENYKTILTDPVFKQAMINSVLLGTVSLLINLFVAFILTIGLNEIKSKFAKSALQTVSFLPYLFSWTVVGGMWIFILSHNGIVNTLLETLGLDKIGFFTTASMGRPVILFTNAWKQAGYFCVLFLASVVGIDPALYEAAIIDGASRMKQIRYIILPQLIPTISTLLVVGATGVLRNFDQVLMLERPVTKDGIRTVLLYIYEEGIIKSKTGKATAAAVIVLLVTMVITVITRRISGYDQD